jgi:photosystem II stability/assembly factor-like uncharacterized protein
MLSPLIRAILFWSLLFLSCSSIKTQESSRKNQPFALTWIEGKCEHCRIARQLSKVEFVSKTEAWGIGFLWNYHGEGSGDYVIVHTVDGGRTWKELSASRTHAVEPSFAFLNPKVGWISYMNESGEYVAKHTVDGGNHWKTQGLGVQLVKFFNEREGYGYGFCKTEKQCFFRTTDGGRTWAESGVLETKFVGNAFFLNSQTGWIAGMNEGKTLILRTVDGGAHWDATKVYAGPDIADVRDVFFLNDHRGWFISWAFNDDGTRLFKTEDGGKTWEADGDGTFQKKRKWLSQVRFIDESVGFIFNSVDTSNTVLDPVPGADGYVQMTFANWSQNNLLYTNDGGQHWEKFAIPRMVNDCDVFEQVLLCSAVQGESGLWLLKVQPVAK